MSFLSMGRGHIGSYGIGKTRTSLHNYRSCYLRQDDPEGTIHFVAHSHGGNVVLEGLSEWFQRLYWKGQYAFSIVLKQIKDAREKSETGRRKSETFKTPPTREEVRDQLMKVFQNAAPSEKEANDMVAIGARVALSASISALSENSANDLVEELCRIPTVTPFPWRSFILNLDLGGLSPIGRVGEKITFWASTAAAVWMAHPSVHGIGRLIFFGTPFLLKKWHSNQDGYRAVAEKVRQVVMAAIELIFLLYISGTLAATFVEPARSWNPAEWPAWVIGLVVFLGTAWLPNVAKVIHARERHDTNVYFNQGREELRLLGHAMSNRSRIPCLVVSAGLMDEALLGLSVQPVLSGAFKPQLQRWFGLRPDDDKPDATSGGEAHPLERGADWFIWSRGQGLATALLRATKWVLEKVLFPAKALWGMAWRCSLAPMIEARTLRTIRSVMDMTALGLPAQELRRARVEVSKAICVADVFDEYHADVTRSAIARAALQYVPRVQERYEFLLAAAKLPRVDDSHHLYRALVCEGIEDRALLEEALVIDERVKEVVGAVGLIHSTYYGDEDVRRAAAHFIRTGHSGETPRQPRSMG